MADIYYPGITAGDAASVGADGIVRAVVTPNTFYQVFELGDTTFSNPLTVKTPGGLTDTKVPVGDLPIFPDVYVVSSNFAHMWKSGELRFRRDSADAKDQAVAEAVAAALAAVSAAQAPSDEAVAAGIGRANFPQLAAQAVAASPTVVAAAEAAVVNSMTAKFYGITLTPAATSGTEDPMSGWTAVRNGPADFTGTPKQGFGALKSTAVLRRPLTLPVGASVTIEFFLLAPMPTGLSTGQARLAMSFEAAATNLWVGVGQGGFLRVCSGGNPSSAATNSAAVLTDGFYHHVAVVLTDNGAGGRRVTAAFLDGVALPSGSWLAVTTAVDTATVGGFVNTSALTWETGSLIDGLRISAGARYSANFTPPSALAADGSTMFFTGFDPQTAGARAYPARPNAPGGVVSYVGDIDPTGQMLPGDRWYQL